MKQVTALHTYTHKREIYRPRKFLYNNNQTSPRRRRRSHNTRIHHCLAGADEPENETGLTDEQQLLVGGWEVMQGRAV